MAGTERDSRSYPERPLLGVSIALWRQDRVLIARRGKPPLAGLWSLPGGLVERGERLKEAVRRELKEETGLDCDPVGIADWREIILRDDAGEVERHYVLAVFAAHWREGEPRAEGDATEVRWARAEELQGLHMTEGAEEAIGRTRRFLDG